MVPAFLDFLGLSPAVVKTMLWELIGPLWEAMSQLLEDAYNALASLVGWTQDQTGDNITAKVAFVAAYTHLLREWLTHSSSIGGRNRGWSALRDHVFRDRPSRTLPRDLVSAGCGVVLLRGNETLLAQRCVALAA
jgi:hypothetical protein